jgi:uncharacterized protein YggE
MAALVFSSNATAQITIVPDPARTIHVTGHGALSVAPDTATITVGVFARDTDLKKAKGTVDGAIQKIIAIGERLQVQPGDLKTSRLNVNPQYESEGAQRFVGFDVTRSATFVLRDIARLEPLLDAAIDAGANRDFDVELASSRESQVKQDALTRALTDARAQAEHAAGTLGLHVGAVRSVTLNKAAATYATASNYAIPGARFLPGQIKIDAEASVSFLLEDVAPVK